MRKVEYDLNQQKETLSLMVDAYNKKLEAENKCNGLIILNAYYGKPSLEIENEKNVELVDVKIPLQILVNLSTLHISDILPKCDLVGFCDPCPWVKKKKLVVKYTFQGKNYGVTIGDMESLDLPRRSHLIDL
jgi:DnaJ family protein C protein 11